MKSKYFVYKIKFNGFPFIYQKGGKKMCDEIEFNQPVRINLIRIVKPGLDVH